MDLKPLPLKTSVKMLMTNPSYVLAVLIETMIMFFLTGQTYWLTSYTITVLGGDEDFVHAAFAFSVLTAPSFGALTGSIISSKWFGGYRSSKALTLSFVIYCIYAVFCIVCPFINNCVAFLPVMWMAIFM